jgi:hypothetical protein
MHMEEVAWLQRRILRLAGSAFAHTGEGRSDWASD